ncbi:MAG: response regulator [Cystobacterineae bacterium]|nr:response regulator [Cystobacterineae bacterium]
MSPAPHILISDDDPLLVAAVMREAKKLGMSVIADTTSTQVVQMAKQYHPAVILLDIRQPVDGRDILSMLKADPETQNIRVIMLSGVEDQYTRLTCLRLGAEDYVVKPFGPTLLINIFRSICNREATCPSLPLV